MNQTSGFAAAPPKHGSVAMLAVSPVVKHRDSIRSRPQPSAANPGPRLLPRKTKNLRFQIMNIAAASSATGSVELKTLHPTKHVTSSTLTGIRRETTISDNEKLRSFVILQYLAAALNHS